MATPIDWEKVAEATDAAFADVAAAFAGLTTGFDQFATQIRQGQLRERDAIDAAGTILEQAALDAENAVTRFVEAAIKAFENVEAAPSA